MAGITIGVTGNINAMLADLKFIEKTAVPRALANVTNRAATRARKLAATELAKAENKRQKDLNPFIRVPVRANAKTGRLFAIIRAFGWTLINVPTSKAFTVVVRRGQSNQKTLRVRRALHVPEIYAGPLRTAGRPSTSSPNLPLINDERSRKKLHISRSAVVRRHAERVVRVWVPPNLVREIEKQAAKSTAKISARRSRALSRALGIG